MTRIAIVVGSTRPGRNGEAVAKWVHEVATTRTDAEFELVDILEQDLPLLDEPIPPSQHKYQNEHTKRWAAVIAPFDGYVFVTPEYNHGTSAALKNALDYLYQEWNDKAAGFVAYGSVGGTRAVEQLRLVCAELQMATVRAQVALNLREDFEDYTRFKPRPHHTESLHTVLDQVVAWAGALKPLRAHGSETARPPRPGREAAHRKEGTQASEAGTAGQRTETAGQGPGRSGRPPGSA